MSEPTKEQIKWFWEQCLHECVHDWDKTLLEGIKPDCYDCVCNKCGMKFTFATGRFFAWGHEYDFPPIDLNNLFKYAVPKLYYIEIKVARFHLYQSVMVQLEYKSEPTCSQDKDPAPALFCAISKAFEAGRQGRAVP
ncbi:hypothetical protein LCGC14_1014160 [marine sediment metagenome]|uniref:Uncharacterized protein n=1 Tax=marine sediment metagenome TaxID=412755 RepID=A0A0F9QHP2_9ZZZZ